MRYSSKSKADRIIFSVLMSKLAKGNFVVERAEVQQKSGLSDNEFTIGLEMLVSESIVREQAGQQLALTRQGIMCYEVTRPITFA